METSDAVLVEQCLEGNTDAYDELVRRYQDAVFNLLVKMTGNWHEAADLTQEAFLRAYRKLSAYDPRLSFKTWVITIGVNLTKNRFRSLFRRRRAEGLAAEEWDRRSNPPGADNPRVDRTRQALARLPEKLRAPLVLRHMEGYSYEEIARILGIGTSAAKMRVMRGRDEFVRRLREIE